MKLEKQSVEQILLNLQVIEVDWQDDTARQVITKLSDLPIKKRYSRKDIISLLETDFDEGSLILRLFLGLSKDNYLAQLQDLLGEGGAGVTKFRNSPDDYLQALEKLGVLDAMAVEVNRQTHWSDVLVERLRSGRGSAISGQKRGRGAEDLAEEVVRAVFHDQYSKRCSFKGARGIEAKSDFAIPSKSEPRIVVEAKAYGATGSKMTDVIGDIEKIISAKRPDTAFQFFTDGLPWRRRENDLRKIIKYQNHGDITRIYTISMLPQFKADLQTLKRELAL
jgi:hypothetical protein